MIDKVTIGIDQSLRGTGIVIMKDTIVLDWLVWTNKDVKTVKNKIVDYVNIFSSDMDKDELKRDISTIIPLRIGNIFGIENEIDINVVFEGYSFRSTGRCIADIAEIIGMIKKELELCQFVNERFYSITPRSLKKHMTGSGNAEKEDVIKAVSKRWGLIDDIHEKVRNDVADAYSLCCCYQEVLDDIRK